MAAPRAILLSLRLLLQKTFLISLSQKKNLKLRCSASSNIPFPPINPNDSLLSKLSSLAANTPDSLLQRPINSDTPSFLDLFDSPQLMGTPAQVERSVLYDEHRPKMPPPDLPSLLLHGQIVYIGMPVVIGFAKTKVSVHGFLGSPFSVSKHQFIGPWLLHVRATIRSKWTIAADISRLILKVGGV